ncbi:hypothetical protein HCU64_15980 [Methylobacterium sp. C25]|uniref:hypothetical protein n=1 Tax=Methylobacterium sp. C25 TaxID=2721622 RepID=UPI001F33EAB9|nr:hypothetical protein [Methylobacterium sp. C25]MCE4225256.1 hypothetical protein [Methylobacterium sp. C25]
MDIKDIGHSAASSSLDTAERAYRAIVAYPDGESIDGANVSVIMVLWNTCAVR